MVVGNDLLVLESNQLIDQSISVSWSGKLCSTNLPVEISQKAAPAPGFVYVYRCQIIIFFSLSMVWLKTVPGVMIFTTSRFTIPLAVEGSLFAHRWLLYNPFQLILQYRNLQHDTEHHT